MPQSAAAERLLYRTLELTLAPDRLLLALRIDLRTRDYMQQIMLHRRDIPAAGKPIASAWFGAGAGQVGRPEKVGREGAQ